MAVLAFAFIWKWASLGSSRFDHEPLLANQNRSNNFSSCEWPAYSKKSLHDLLNQKRSVLIAALPDYHPESPVVFERLNSPEFQKIFSEYQSLCRMRLDFSWGDSEDYKIVAQVVDNIAYTKGPTLWLFSEDIKANIPMDSVSDAIEVIEETITATIDQTDALATEIKQSE